MIVKMDRMISETRNKTLQATSIDRSIHGQVVLVLQGGGALGSYQGGVYQALHEAGLEPDWVIGTSIGAINAALIAGNPVSHRLDRLQEFWRRVEYDPISSYRSLVPGLTERMSYWSIVLGGIPDFFIPNAFAHLSDSFPLGTDRAGFYSPGPLRKMLEELVDLDCLNSQLPRLTVGTAHIRTSQMKYFDTRDGKLDIDHIMASAALPPAFPAMRIDGELYWDGGILSNTPTEVVFDDQPRRNALMFSVHLWNPAGSEPQTMGEVFNRHKDIQYSSRIANQITRQEQIHRLRHVIARLADKLPESARESADVKELVAYGCRTQMHVVRLLAPSVAGESHVKDIDFSAHGIKQRWQAGYEHARRALEAEPWNGTSDPLAGVILHEPGDLP